MKPRIFISSTFYDLKYIREDLSNYVKAHDFEPIMFEDGDIGYTPGKYLDESCYEAMRNADMVILIIGGEYGSPSSTDNAKEFEEYISITRKEFRTAVENGIPVFCMIDSKVVVEYGVYEANINEIEINEYKISFNAVKNINVFRFIKEIKNIGRIPIQEFKNAAEIKEFLGKQWADMFKNYLVLLKTENENKKIENSVSEMKELIKKMDIMLGSVGKSILAKDNPSEYENVIIQQDIISVCRLIAKSFDIECDFEYSDIESRKSAINKFVNNLRDSLKNDMWRCFKSHNREEVKMFFDKFRTNDFHIESITCGFLEHLGDKEVVLNNEESASQIADILATDEYFDMLLDPFA